MNEIILQLALQVPVLAVFSFVLLRIVNQSAQNQAELIESFKEGIQSFKEMMSEELEHCNKRYTKILEVILDQRKKPE